MPSSPRQSAAQALNGPTGSTATRYAPAQPPAGPADDKSARRAPRLWPGSGGRWPVWVLRIVLWTVLLLIGYRGIAAIVMGTPGPGGTSAASAPAAGGAPSGQFPAALAQAYALEFGQVYLNFSADKAAQRARSLAAFLPRGSDPMFGWNGAATRTLQSEQVAGVRVVDEHRAVVTLLARVNGGLLELGVPDLRQGTRHGGLRLPGAAARPGTGDPAQATARQAGRGSQARTPPGAARVLPRVRERRRMPGSPSSRQAGIRLPASAARSGSPGSPG